MEAAGNRSFFRRFHEIQESSEAVGQSLRDHQSNEMTAYINSTLKIRWEDYGKNRLQTEQAHKAHSSAFCIDLHRQTLMTMMGNDDNDGQ